MRPDWWLMLVLFLGGCASTSLRGTGDLGVVIERASGSIQVVDTSRRVSLGRVEGLGDLSHASVNFSRDGRFAYIFGRDGGLSRVDLLTLKVTHRILQSGNSIGGAISQDGRLIAAANYTPGGVKIFAADDLHLLAEIPAVGADGRPSKVVGLVDAPGRRFIFSLFEAGEIWVADVRDPHRPRLSKYPAMGREPYDGMISADGRFYAAGLFGEDGVALLDLWQPAAGVRRVLTSVGRKGEKLPVFKMPHLEGWATSGNVLVLPEVGRHEAVLADAQSWEELARIPVAGQVVFAVANPAGRHVWLNFAPPHNDTVQILDVASRRIVATLKPGRAVLHMEFTPRGEAVWVSCRDDDRIQIYDSYSFELLGSLPAKSPSGIFFTHRAHRIGL
ncbi:MAG: protein nirF [Burkholderiales bacterium]|nr:protein nirF [Burkholderiales bacterium]